MLDHHLQRAIVYRLALADGLRFSELKPSRVENKLFDYHLKKTMAAKLVEKTSEGLYDLTPEGRRLGIRVLDNNQALVDRAESVLFLVIRRKQDGAWLLYRRTVHPLKDKVGFMHATPLSSESTMETATRECAEKTGLNAAFRPLGGGYFRVFQDGELESFTHFTLMLAEDVSGELAQNDDHAEYFWQEKPDFSAEGMLPNMQVLHQRYQAGETFFIEETLG